MDCIPSFSLTLSPAAQTVYLRRRQALSVRWQAAVLIHDDHALLGESEPSGLEFASALSLLLQHPQHTLLSDVLNSLSYLQARQETGMLLWKQFKV